MLVKIQGSDENIYTVNLYQSSCSCSRKGCEHLATATDVYVNHGRRLRFSIISAAHKTTRTSRLELAWPWIETFSRISGGMDKVARYFSKSIFEETRNLQLWEKIRNNEISSEQQVRSLVLSRKKWESIPGFSRHMDWWISAHSEYQTNKNSWTETKLRMRLSKCTTPLDGYEIWFFVKDKKQFRPAFWDALSAKAEKEKNERLRWFLKLQPSTGYDCLVGIELALNLLDKSCEEFHPEGGQAVDYVPAFFHWIDDVHSYLGRRRFIHWFPHLLDGTLPRESKLCLQLSGQIWGCAYRFSAFNQKNAITTSDGSLFSWQEIPLEQSLVEIAHLDSFFYKKIYTTLEDKGSWSYFGAGRQ